MSDSFQIYLNSTSANVYRSGTSSVEFNFTNIDIPDDYQIHLGVQSASIPISFYNVNNNNNTIYYTLTTDSILYHITLPIGNYNVNTLLAQLNVSLANFTITFNKLTNKFRFEHATSNFTFNYQNNIKSTCFGLLGLSRMDQISSARILSSDCVINLSPIRMIGIGSNLRTGNMNMNNINQQHVLVQIPVDNNALGVVNYINTTGIKSNLFTNHISSINIKILDQEDNLIDLNGVHWSIVLQFDIIKYI